MALIFLGNASFSSCFAPSALSNSVLPRAAANSLCATKQRMESEADSMVVERESKTGNFVVTEKFVRRGIASMVAMGVVLTLGISAPAFADEYGRESEAQFLPTGETVMICMKRGPLGKCTKTERRTVENENDKSEKYFQQPTELVTRKDNEARTSESTEGNELIERLKKQSEENFEKNEALVFQRTQLNDSVSPTTFCLSSPYYCIIFFLLLVLFSLHSRHAICRSFVSFRNCLLVCELWSFRFPGADSERRWERVFPSYQPPSHAIEEGWIYRKQEIY